MNMIDSCRASKQYHFSITCLNIFQTRVQFLVYESILTRRHGSWHNSYGCSDGQRWGADSGHFGSGKQQQHGSLCAGVAVPEHIESDNG